MVLNKTLAIRVLIGLNLALLVGLILSVSKLPVAKAQVQGRPGDYIMSTIQFHEDRDGLVVINNPGNIMGVFLANPQNGKLSRIALRNLTNDFRRQRTTR